MKARPPFKPCMRISRTRLTRWSSGRGMHDPRILNRAAQANEPEGLEEGTRPRHRPPRGQTRPRALEEQPAESAFDVLVEVGEMVRRITRAKVLPPAAEHRIQLRDHEAEVRVTPGARRQVTHAGAHSRHRTLRRTPLEVEDALPRPLPDRPAHALAQVAPQEVKPLAPTREFDRPRLLQMELEPQTREHGAHPLPGLLDLCLRVTHHHEVVSVANQCAQSAHRSSHTRSRTCR